MKLAFYGGIHLIPEAVEDRAYLEAIKRVPIHLRDCISPAAFSNSVASEEDHDTAGARHLLIISDQ